MSRYIKYNESYKTKYYREKAWYYKENTNANLPKLVIKEGKLCFHSFKCVNYKDDYQADSYTYSYWHNYFNKIWYSKKQ